MKITGVLACGLSLIAAATWSADPPDGRETQTTRNELALAFAKDSLSDVQNFDTDAFAITSFRYRELSAELKPTDRVHSALRIRAKVTAPLNAILDRGPDTNGLAVYSDDGETLLQLGRRSGAQSNHLTYTVLDAQGKPKLDVHDYEMDGQADMRFHFSQAGQPGYVELWYLDRWYRMQRQATERFITVDGKRKPVVSRDGRLIVTEG